MGLLWNRTIGPVSVRLSLALAALRIARPMAKGRIAMVT